MAPAPAPTPVVGGAAKRKPAICLAKLESASSFARMIRRRLEPDLKQSLKAFPVLALLGQASESLAGRIAYHELRPFVLDEVGGNTPDQSRDKLWLRGGFPDSFLAESDRVSWQWREQFISTYLERDIPQIAPRIAATQ